MKFRKKPIEIEAFQYDGDFQNAKGEWYVPEWAVNAFKDGVMYYDSWNGREEPCELFIHTLGGRLHVSVGDYVIQDIHGRLYPCKPDVFVEKYEAAS